MQHVGHQQQRLSGIQQRRISQLHCQQLKQRIELHELQTGLGKDFLARDNGRRSLDHPLGAGVAIANSPSGATESGSTATITTTTPHGFVVGQKIRITKFTGTASGYNGDFTITAAPTTTTFTYTDTTTSLPNSGGGVASLSPDVILTLTNSTSGASIGVIPGTLLLDPTNTIVTFKATNEHLDQLTAGSGLAEPILPDGNYTVSLP